MKEVSRTSEKKKLRTVRGGENLFRLLINLQTLIDESGVLIAECISMNASKQPFTL